MFLTPSRLLVNFRNYVQLELESAPGITLLQGNNAAGQDERAGSHFLFGRRPRSPHAGAERELIHWGAASEPIPFRAGAGIGGVRERTDGGVLEIVLVTGEDRVLTTARVSKRIKVNGVTKRARLICWEI